VTTKISQSQFNIFLKSLSQKSILTKYKILVVAQIFDTWHLAEDFRGPRHFTNSKILRDDASSLLIIYLPFYAFCTKNSFVLAEDGPQRGENRAHREGEDCACRMEAAYPNHPEDQNLLYCQS
jgi:hypothetical protein